MPRDFVVRKVETFPQTEKAVPTTPHLFDNSRGEKFNLNGLNVKNSSSGGQNENHCHQFALHIKMIQMFSPMKMCRLVVLLCLPPVLAVLSAGCASHRPVVSAWNNSQLSLTRADKLALTLRPDPSPEDAELGRILVAELQREGFDLVPIEKADYLLACALGDDWEQAQQHQMITTTIPGSPPQTTRQILAQTQPSLTSSVPESSLGVPASSISKPFIFHSRGIRLFLYNNPKTHPGRLQIAWQGYITVEKSVSAERETVLVKTLLGYWGQEQHGPVNLPP